MQLTSKIKASLTCISVFEGLSYGWFQRNFGRSNYGRSDYSSRSVKSVWDSLEFSNHLVKSLLSLGVSPLVPSCWTSLLAEASLLSAWTVQKEQCKWLLAAQHPSQRVRSDWLSQGMLLTEAEQEKSLGNTLGESVSSINFLIFIKTISPWHKCNVQH